MASGISFWAEGGERLSFESSMNITSKDEYKRYNMTALGSKGTYMMLVSVSTLTTKDRSFAYLKFFYQVKQNKFKDKFWSTIRNAKKYIFLDHVLYTSIFYYLWLPLNPYQQLDISLELKQGQEIRNREIGEFWWLGIWVL